jgi:hypothetical protein
MTRQIDPVQAEISSDKQGTSTEFNFEEDRTFVEELIDTCGSTGNGTWWQSSVKRRVHIHGIQWPLEDKIVLGRSQRGEWYCRATVMSVQFTSSCRSY